MITRTTASDVKTHFLALLDEVESGETVEITRHGRLIARLVPARGSTALKGNLVGVAMTAADDEDLFSTGTRWELE
jgi:prevent-host-death family protein